MSWRGFKQRTYEVLEVNAIGDKTSRLVEVFIIVLVLGNLLSVVLETVPDIREAHAHLFAAIEVASVLVFAGEFGLRLWVADLHPPFARSGPLRSRLSFMLQPQALVDFLSFAPTGVGFVLGWDDVNVLVVFRLLRFLKLARYSPGMRSLTSALASERRALAASAVLMAGLIVSTATVMYWLEREAQPDRFGTIPQAMYWAVTTLTTTGYGDVVPITPAGRILAGLTMVAGLCMLALPVGIIATAFSREIHSRDFVVTWSMVARVPLFEGLTASEVAEIAKLLRAQTVEAGYVITRRGDPAHSMYFIASGEVEVDLPERRLQLGEGAFFGEIAVLQKGRRTADVVAMSTCRLLILDAQDLHTLMAKRLDIAEHVRKVAQQRLSREALSPRGDIAATEVPEMGDPGITKS